MKIPTLILALSLSMPGVAFGQESIELADYQRALSYLHENYNNKTAFNLAIRPNWFPDSSGLWYVHHSPKSKKYQKITFPEMEIKDLFDHDRLAVLLSDSLDKEVKTEDLPISHIRCKGSTELILSVEGKNYLFDTQTYSLEPEQLEKEEKGSEGSSPDGKWTAYSEDYNLHIRSADSSEVRQLSTSGKNGYEYASWYGWYDIMEGENGERPERFAMDWSEDSEWISTYICDLRTAQKMYLLDWSIDSLYRPKLLSYYRGSPGDTAMVYMKPVFFHVPTGKEIKPALPRSTHINSINVRWSREPGKVYLDHLTRGYQEFRLHSFDLEKEKLELLYSEKSTTNIDNFEYRLAEESGLLFFLSEKSGWRQLYSLDLESGEEIAITDGTYYVNSIERIDEGKQRIYFTASGKEEGRNPYYQHLYSVSFKGENSRLLTGENRNHQLSFSPCGSYLVDNFSTVNIPTETVLRNSKNGEIIMKLGHADVAALEKWTPPEIYTALARDSATTIYGALWKPTHFDSTISYPILDASYTGPHTHMFPISFTRALSYQSYAELGFVVVVVDGLGSSGRSKAFHDYSYKNLGGNLEDHINAIRQLGKKHSWLDTSRVGIFGHSAGGYDAAHALLAYPDFYKVAVASSADHDHRMEKAWWPEMYMGWPVDSAYHLQSNITMAGNLRGKLLVTHGGIDENVNPSATFKLAEALIRADKQFDMLILPSQRHGYEGKHLEYFRKIRWNYFVEHLRGAKPIWDFDGTE